MKVYYRKNAAGDTVVGDDDRKIRIKNNLRPDAPACLDFVCSALLCQFALEDELYQFRGLDFDLTHDVIRWAKAAAEGDTMRIQAISHAGNPVDLELSIFCDGKFNNPDTYRHYKEVSSNG